MVTAAGSQAENLISVGSTRDGPWLVVLTVREFKKRSVFPHGSQIRRGLGACNRSR